MMTPEYKKMIEEDLKICEAAKETLDGSEQLFRNMVSRYTTFYPNFQKEVSHSGKASPLGQEFDYRPEIKSIIIKLETFRVSGFPERDSSNPGINITTTNTNTNTTAITLSFDDVKKQISDMPISETETSEIINKLNELQNIIESKASKKTKWSKVTPFILWLANKGVDVGLALLPLLLNI